MARRFIDAEAAKISEALLGTVENFADTCPDLEGHELAFETVRTGENTTVKLMEIAVGPDRFLLMVKRIGGEYGYRRGREDYRKIAEEAMDPETPPVEVSEDEYWEMLGVLPPVEVPGGFLVPEPITGCDLGTVVAHFAERGGRYWARYAVRDRPETYMKGGA